MSSIDLADFFLIFQGLWLAAQLCQPIRIPEIFKKSSPNHLNSCFIACSQISMTLERSLLLHIFFWSFQKCLLKITFCLINFWSVNSNLMFFLNYVFPISLGTNSLMFANYSGFCDVWHVRSSVLGQNVIFGSVRSSVRLLCDQTSLGTYSLMFTNCSVFCDVWHVQSSILGQIVMFGKFGVRTFNVQSVWSLVFLCSFLD